MPLARRSGLASSPPAFNLAFMPDANSRGERWELHDDLSEGLEVREGRRKRRKNEVEETRKKA